MKQEKMLPCKLIFPDMLPSNIIPSGIKHASFVWETGITIPLQLFFFTASKFCLGIIWAREGCLFFQMFTWDFCTDGNQVRIIVQCLKLLCWKSINPKCVLYIYKSDVLYTQSKPSIFRKYSKAKHVFSGKKRIPEKKKISQKISVQQTTRSLDVWLEYAKSRVASPALLFHCYSTVQM